MIKVTLATMDTSLVRAQRIRKSRSSRMRFRRRSRTYQRINLSWMTLTTLWTSSRKRDLRTSNEEKTRITLAGINKMLRIGIQLLRNSIGQGKECMKRKCRLLSAEKKNTLSMR